MKKLIPLSFFGLLLPMAYGQENDSVVEIFEEKLIELNNTLNSNHESLTNTINLNQETITENISEIEILIEKESSHVRNLQQIAKDGTNQIIFAIDDHSDDSKFYGLFAIGIAVGAFAISLYVSKIGTIDLKRFITRNRYLQDANTNMTGEFYENAKNSYDKAIELDNTDVSAMLMAGNASSTLEKNEDAVKYYDQILNIDPRYVRALNNKGVALGKVNKHDEAIVCYKNAIKIKPD